MKQKHLFIYAMASILFFFSCSKNECEDALSINEFVVEKKYCLSEDISFSIDSLSDSRCPIDAICVWEGNVILYLTFKNENIMNDTILTIPNKEEAIKFENLNGYQFLVKSINPQPIIGAAIHQVMYKINMEITKE